MGDSRSGKPVRDTAGNMGAWLAGAIASLAYVAITSRAFEPVTVGAYASGVLAELLVYLAVGSGLTVAVQRRADLGATDEAQYLGRALIAGIVAALVMLAGADLWGSLWDNPEAARFTRALAAVALLHPLSLVCIGILRRHDRHRSAAQVLTVAGVGASLLGAVPVIAIGTPLTLIASNFLTPLIMVIGCAAVGVSLRPAFARRLRDGRFATATVVLNLVNYVAYNALAWSVSRFISVSTLGLYSRAWLMADLPAQGMASSASQVLFPSFSRSSDEINRGTASDALTVLAAVAGVVLGAIGALSSLIVVVVLGKSWLDAIALLAVLAVSLSAMPTHWLLASQLQAHSRFRSLAVSRGVALATTTAFVALVVITRDPLVAAAGAGAVHAAAHAADMRSATALGMIDRKAVLRGYLQAALACAPLWAIAILQAAAILEPRSAAGLAGLTLGATAAGVVAVAVLLRADAGAVLDRREALPGWIPGFMRPTGGMQPR
ncbi:MAG: oligosaccharide flippase family protein [Actinomycetes bacterium]